MSLPEAQSSLWQVGASFFQSRILVDITLVLWVELCSIKIHMLQS